MATWGELTKEQKIELLVAGGCDRVQAERQVMLLDGELDPHDVVDLPPAKPLGR